MIIAKDGILNITVQYIRFQAQAHPDPSDRLIALYRHNALKYVRLPVLPLHWPLRAAERLYLLQTLTELLLDDIIML